MDGNLRAKTLSSEKNPDTIHTDDKRRGDGTINMRDSRPLRDAYLEVTEQGDNLDGTNTHFKRDLNHDGCAGTAPVAPAHPVDIFQHNNCSTSDESVYPRYDLNGTGRLDAGTTDVAPPAPALAPFKADPDTDCTSLNTDCRRDIDVLADAAVWEPAEENVTLDTESLPDTTPSSAWNATELDTDRNGDGTIDYFVSFDIHLDVERLLQAPYETEICRSFTGSCDTDTINRVGVFAGVIVATFDQSSTSASFGKARTGDWQGVLTVPAFQGDTLVGHATDNGEEIHSLRFQFAPTPGEDVKMVARHSQFE